MAGEAQDVVLCFLFFALFIGAVTTYLLSRLAPGVPYTVVLFVLGILISLIVTSMEYNVLGISVLEWENIDPELLLFVFLPALLFGEAMGLNIHDFKLTFFPALCLAGPGAVFGTVLLAAMCHAVLPYGWSWNLCFTFGSILCATDPVAVVALLKEVGAAPNITMLVTQEALLNDGAALVLYNMFFSYLLVGGSGEYATGGSVVAYFFKVVFVSPLLGCTLGLGTCAGFALANARTNHGDVIVQAALTLCCAYLSFFLGESTLGVSGVICCCAAGVVISWLGPPLILQHETMHSVWATFEWIGNTLIFLLAGLLFGRETLQHVEGRDVAMVLVVYLMLHAIRAIMVIGFYPVLRRGAYGLNAKECVFLTWGGLRGAVGMALALSLVRSSAQGQISVEPHTAHKLFFIVGGCAALTLLVNATTAAWMLGALGLVEESSPAIRTMQQYARKRIYKAVLQVVVNLRDELPEFDHSEVEALVLHDSKQLQSSKPLPSLVAAGASDAASSPRRSTTASSISMQDGRTDRYLSLDHHDGGDGDGGGGGEAMPRGLKRTFTLEAATSGLRPHGAQTRGLLLDYYQYQQPEEDTAAAKVDVNGGGDGQGNMASLEAALGARRLTAPSVDYGMGTLSPSSSPRAGIGAGSWKSSEFYPAPLKAAGRLQPSLSVASSSPSVENPLHAGGDGGGEDGLTSRTQRRPTVAQLLRKLSMSASEAQQIALGLIPPTPATADPALMVHVRTAFLEVLRATYWRHVEHGKLPRRSNAAILLLGSVDFAQGSVLRDWDYLQPHLERPEWWMRALATGGDWISGHLSAALFERGLVPCKDHLATALTEALDEWHEGLCIHMLASYIEARQCAQKTIPHYMREDENTGSPEEVAVLAESEVNMARAREMLRSYPAEVVSQHVAQRVGQIITRTKEDLVEHFGESGLLRPKDAEVLLHEIHAHARHSTKAWRGRLWRVGRRELRTAPAGDGHRDRDGDTAENPLHAVPKAGAGSSV